MKPSPRHLIALPLALFAFALPCRAGSPGTLQGAAAVIGESVYREHLAVLASDAMQGRAPGTEGEQRTVAYLEQQYRLLGLRPGAGDSYRQEVPYVEITAPQPKLEFVAGKTRVPLAALDDMVLVSRRERTEVAVRDSEVVFVGYGIVAPEYGWNDYAGVDMHGKTALILVNDPGYATGDETLFRGRAMTYHGRWTYKYEEAARQGATAAILVHDTGPAAYDWEVVREGWSGPQLYPESADGNAGRSALEGWITNARARELLALAGQDLTALSAAATQRGFRAVPLGLRASGSLHNTIRRARSPNLAAVLPGSEHPDEYVAYVAHWDHLGVGKAGDGDRIFNGAVDNATGVAALLAIARGFHALERPPSRSVLFLAVTAEESGTIGSEYFAANPLIPLEKTAAVINIDALLPLGRATSVEVIGHGASELEELLAQVAAAQGRTLTPDRRAEAGYFYRSDHFAFAEKGVPALYIKSGTDLRDQPAGRGLALHDAYYAERYHKPGDEYRADWDVSGSVEDLRLLFEVGARVAASRTWPAWYQGNEFRAARDASAPLRGK